MTDPDIVIVGSGAAGIGAALRLERSGLCVLMLEALPRSGGRAFTWRAEGIPVDLGCGWLHSGERNPWTAMAGQTGFVVDRSLSAWGRQYRGLGFPPADQAAARQAFVDWSERLISAPPASDIALDAVPKGSPWLGYLQALSSYISGDDLERISARDYAAYDQASSDCNWRLPAGYGTLICAGLPSAMDLRLDTPVQAIALEAPGVTLRTPKGTVRARAAILTVSTRVLESEAIALPTALDPWREAAHRLPLGFNEKLYLGIEGDGVFEPETNVMGSPQDGTTGNYYIRPFGRPVIECFVGGAGARRAQTEGREAAFTRAIDQLVNLFGTSVRPRLRGFAASNWAGTKSIGGGYSHALPGHSAARKALAHSFENRLFFAGEATHETDFSTAHGAYESGRRAADEAIAALKGGEGRTSFF